MRKTFAGLAALSISALFLTGCAVSASDTYDGKPCDRAASKSGVDGSVTVDGDFGVAPDVSVYAPISVDSVEKTGYTDLIRGDGTPITSPNQLTALDVALYDGTTGDQIVQTAFSGDRSQLSNVASWGEQIPGIGDVLECATPGTRMLAAITPEDFGARGLAGFQLSAETTVIAVIDVLDTQLSRATGSLQYNDAQGMPTVVRAPDGRPGIIVPDGASPTTLTVQVLVQGDGDVVAEGSRPWVNYTAVSWDNKDVTGTTWGDDPTNDLTQAMPDVVGNELVGKTVGSQVLVVVPGASGGGAATVYVVDILGSGTLGS